FTTNNGYGFQVIAHWISSYFLGDKMRLPFTIEEALDETESKRWPQTTDELLDDMGLPNMRSGGNWIMWLPVLKAISVDEIARLREERHTKREADALQPESSFPLAK
ncbi:hypothetical protein L210DRAFT_3430732, partial [Boletus edulis BED1]